MYDVEEVWLKLLDNIQPDYYEVVTVSHLTEQTYSPSNRYSVYFAEQKVPDLELT